jgi:gamma-glutamyltranspeptidase / glutathione hydrolase
MQRGIVSCGHPQTAQAAISILEAGGNAFDAMIAAGLMTYVAEPSMTSAGGGGFMNVWTAKGENILFDFFVQTPLHKRPEKELDFYAIEIDFGATKQTFHVGLGGAATPGNLAGLFHVHKRLGSLPFSVIAAPAVEAARKGVVVTPYANYLLELVGPAITSKDEGKALFMQNGKMKPAGATIAFPDFADTLEHMAKQGNAREFYEGEIAQRIAKDCKEKGGYLTLDDLKNFQVYERKPLQVQYGNYTVSTNPPPATGGSLIAFMLKLLEPLQLNQFGFGSGQHLHHLANAMRLTAASRSEILDKKLYENQVLLEFLDDTYLAKVRNSLPKFDDTLGSTTHISIADKAGNIAAMTTSHGQGCGYIIPKTGIMLSNMLGEADLNPLGFHKWATNQRITSMMSPTLVLKNKQPFAAMGSGGANRIRSAITQVILNSIEFEKSPSQAVQMPRMHWDRNVLDIEPNYKDENVAAIHLPNEVKRTIWQSQNMFFGGVHSIFIDENGKAIGVADDRRAGVVMEI